MKKANSLNGLKKRLLYCISGTIIGLLNGFFGGGGGMVAVPILENILKLDTKKSHASTILIILPLCIVSIITYVIAGSFNFNDGLFVTLGVVIGGIIGALLLKKLNSKTVQYLFAILMIFSGIKLVL